MNKKMSLMLVLVMMGVAVRGWAATGEAEIKGTAVNSSISGKVRLEDTAAGLKIEAALMGVPPGQHAFHIHEFGSCADSGKAAGSHYNPASAPHGQVLKDGVQHAHAGDLGNITAGQDGKATLSAVIPGVTLAGTPYAVAGRAVVLHEKVDDFSQPAGNAGGRIGCGLIVAPGSSPVMPPPPAIK